MNRDIFVVGDPNGAAARDCAVAVGGKKVKIQLDDAHEDTEENGAQVEYVASKQSAGSSEKVHFQQVDADDDEDENAKHMQSVATRKNVGCAKKVIFRQDAADENEEGDGEHWEAAANNQIMVGAKKVNFQQVGAGEREHDDEHEHERLVEQIARKRVVGSAKRVNFQQNDANEHEHEDDSDENRDQEPVEQQRSDRWSSRWSVFSQISKFSGQSWHSAWRSPRPGEPDSPRSEKRVQGHKRAPTQYRSSLRVEKVLEKGHSSHGLTAIASYKDTLESKRQQSLQDNGLRRIVNKVLTSNTFQVLMGIVNVGQMCLGIHDADLRAESTDSPRWMFKVDACILTAYVTELFMRVYLYRAEFLWDRWNLIDSAVVGSDIIIYLAANVGKLSILRCFRMFRMLRVLRRFLIFREFYLMIQGVGSALRTLAFGTLFGFVIMTGWSLLAVEILHPLVQRLVQDGVWEDCERCQRAFSSVMTSNVTFLKIVLAGDSWGEICIPLMENYIEAAVLLTMIFVTLQLGVINIITAVIVDRISMARANDEVLRKTEKEEHLRNSYLQLRKVFRTIDSDGSGSLSIDELEQAYKTNEEFKMLMNGMDFNSDNLNIFFDILDKSHSGEVTYNEFVEQLHLMRNFDSHTMLVIIRHLVETMHDHIDARLDDQEDFGHEILGSLQRRSRRSIRKSTISNTSSSELMTPRSIRKSRMSNAFSSENSEDNECDNDRGKCQEAQEPQGQFCELPSVSVAKLIEQLQRIPGETRLQDQMTGHQSAHPIRYSQSATPFQYASIEKVLEHVDLLEASIRQMIVTVMSHDANMNLHMSIPGHTNGSDQVKPSTPYQSRVPEGTVEQDIVRLAHAARSGETITSHIKKPSQEYLRDVGSIFPISIPQGITEAPDEPNKSTDVALLGTRL